jgi:hypothetical protein
MGNRLLRQRFKLSRCSQAAVQNSLQVREATAEAKAQFDNAELALQNLLYEKGHYLKEIRACQSFRSAAAAFLIFAVSQESLKSPQHCQPCRASSSPRPCWSAPDSQPHACRSRYSDEDIGLMPLEEFLASAPEQFKAGLSGADGTGDAHALMLSRLDHEAHERAQALQRLEALRSRRDALAATVAGKRAFLQALQVPHPRIRP